MCFLSNFGYKIIFTCSFNFWHQQESNPLFKGSIGHVTSRCKWPIAWENRAMHQAPNVQGRVWSFKGVYLEKVKPQALELGYSGLHRMVQDKDLFAKEAEFHPSCRKSFNLRCANYLSGIARTKSPVPYLFYLHSLNR